MQSKPKVPDLKHRIAIHSDLHAAWGRAAKQERECIFNDADTKTRNIAECRRSQANLRAIKAELEAL